MRRKRRWKLRFVKRRRDGGKKKRRNIRKKNRKVFFCPF